MGKPPTRESIEIEIAFLRRKQINHTTTIEMAVDDLIEHLKHELRALDVIEEVEKWNCDNQKCSICISTRRFREGS